MGPINIYNGAEYLYMSWIINKKYAYSYTFLTLVKIKFNNNSIWLDVAKDKLFVNSWKPVKSLRFKYKNSLHTNFNHSAPQEIMCWLC